MEDEELPSESTARPVFRRKLLNNTTSTNANPTVNSFTNIRDTTVKLTHAKTEKRSSKRRKQTIPRKKKPSLHSTPLAKSKKSTTNFDTISTDDELYDGYDPSVVQKPTSNKSVTHINLQVEENLIDPNASFASDATDTNEPDQKPDTTSKTTTHTKEDVLKYFTKQTNGEFKCNLCVHTSKRFSKTNESSDTNFRSHLGRIHQLTEFLYPSQYKVKPPKVEQMSYQRKKQLDEAAVQAIIQDSHGFNLFRNTGMKHFLSVAVPGYCGPHRHTVVKRLKSTYKQHRSTTRLELSTISDISLSADMWKNSRREYFLCLSAHYYDEQYQSHSSVLAFRQFHGNHYSERIKNFLINEIEKLEIQTKICSLTTDNGSDIRAAIENGSQFGIRISCILHNLNLIVQNGLWLFTIPKKIKTALLSTTNTLASTISFSPSNINKSSSPSSSTLISTQLNPISSSTSNKTISDTSTSNKTKSNTPSTSNKTIFNTPSTSNKTISNTSLPSNKTKSNTPSTSNKTISNTSLSSASNKIKSHIPLSILNTTKSNTLSSKPNTNKSNTLSSKPNTNKSNSTSLSNSDTTKSAIISVVCPESSTDDDDYDFAIDDDKVSNGIVDDSGSDISNEYNDPDNLSGSASTTTTSSSLSLSSNDGLYSTPSRKRVYDNSLNLSLVREITEEEEFINQALADPTILLLKTNILLNRLRKLIGMIHNASNLNRYYLNEIKLKFENSNQRTNDQDKKKTKHKELTLDMRIRWNSTFVMISRFLYHSSIVTSLTHDPYKKVKLKSSQYRKLKNLSFTSLDWSLLKALENVLGPFNDSTKLLSTRCRPTLSISQCIKNALTNFLIVSDDAPVTLENLLKKQLLFNLNFYFEKHVSDEQSRATLVAAFLDPSTYRYLTCNDKKEAEAIIINEAPTHYQKLKSKSSLPASQSSILTSSNKNDQQNQLNSLQNLFKTCGVRVQSEQEIFKPSTIKEEIAQYITTISHNQTFSQYWNGNKDRLPILSSMVRRYNIMCATSIDCESAFSVAGHVHRKNRSSLAPSTLRYTMLLREYYKNKNT